MSLITQRQSGFTLIEIIIVVAIIGVLAAIALPSYSNYVTRTKRNEAMIELQQIAIGIESEKLVYKKYSNIPLSQIATPGAVLDSGEFDYPIKGDSLYKVSFWDITGTPTQITADTLSTRNWQIRAIPVSTSRMKDDGLLSIDNKGERCWKTSCGMNDEWQDDSQ